VREQRLSVLPHGKKIEDRGGNASGYRRYVRVQDTAAPEFEETQAGDRRKPG
jgi:hypothetical protein